MSEQPFELLPAEGGVPVKMWTRGVPVEAEARAQLQRAAKLPFIFKHIAAMPDVHVGIGATVGSVIPTRGAVIPAAVGVDIGCGMMAARTSLHASDLPDNLEGIRSAIECAVPHGRNVGRGKRDRGSWNDPPPDVKAAWATLAGRFKAITAKYPQLARTNTVAHLGTLGTRNHFTELCLDEAQRVWVLLHSGSRGVGNAIGTFFIALAKNDMRRLVTNLPDEDLAYFTEGTAHFDDYVEAVGWAQDFAALNRRTMMHTVIGALRGKDEHVLDETPAAYKPIEAAMKAQADLVEIVHTLKQVVCVKG